MNSFQSNTSLHSEGRKEKQKLRKDSSFIFFVWLVLVLLRFFLVWLLVCSGVLLGGGVGLVLGFFLVGWLLFSFPLVFFC